MTTNTLSKFHTLVFMFLSCMVFCLTTSESTAADAKKSKTAPMAATPTNTNAAPVGTAPATYLPDVCNDPKMTDKAKGTINQYDMQLGRHCGDNPSVECLEEFRAMVARKCYGNYGKDEFKRQDCNDAYKEFTDNKSKLSTACAGAGVDGDCFAHIDKCIKCQGSNPSDPICESLPTNDDYASTDSDSTPASIGDFLGAGGGKPKASGQKYTPDIKRSRMRYKNCPSMAGDDLEKWMDRVKDARATASDKKKEILELKVRNDEIDAELRDTIVAKDEEMQAVVDEADDVKQEMNNALGEEKNAARKLIAQLLEQSDNLENQIIAASKAYDDAYSAYLNALAALDQQCHAAALQKLAAMQSRMQNLIDKSTYSTDSFNKLLSQVGVSDRKKAQSMVNRDFLRCKADPAYSSTAQAAKRALDSAQAASNNAIRTMREKQDQIKKTIADASERELPETLQRVIADANRRLSKLQTTLRQIATRKQSAIEDANKKKTSNMESIQLAAQEADVAEQTLIQYQAYLNEKMVASGGIASDASKVSEAMNYLGLTRSSAESVASNCSCNMDAGTAQNEGKCREACRTLVKSHEDWDPTQSITSSDISNECSSLGNSTKSGPKTKGTSTKGTSTKSHQ